MADLDPIYLVMIILGATALCGGIMWWGSNARKK